MKPAAFEYYDPRSVDEALRLVAELAEESKVLARRALVEAAARAKEGRG